VCYCYATATATDAHYSEYCNGLYGLQVRNDQCYSAAHRRTHSSSSIHYTIGLLAVTTAMAIAAITA
jgi:hypothetical protein